MALARLEVLEGRTPEEKRKLVEAVRTALSDALKAPADDPVVRLTEYPRGEFTLPYPDRHSDRYALVEVTMFAGRSMATKQRLYDEVVSRLEGIGIPRDDVGFKVDI